MYPPELSCMEPEHYKKVFRALYWSGIRKDEKKSQKNKTAKKEKLKRLMTTSNLASCNAPMLLGNPSQFAVYAAVRKAIFTRWRYLSSSTSELSDESENDDVVGPSSFVKIPKITGIGLRTVFTLISQARFTDANFCEEALKALLDVLQGFSPEELYYEQNEIISNLHAMLEEVACGSGPGGRSDACTNLTALSSSCLTSLSVARGEAELVLKAVAALIMSQPSLTEQYIQIPLNLTSLQRSVQSVILGAPSRNLWLNYGVPHQSLATSFPVDLPTQLSSMHGELIVRSLASDGCFLYVYTSKGLMKIGSGYGSSIRQHVYVYKSDFFCSDRHGWLGHCKNKLFLRLGRKKTEIIEVDKETLEERNVIKLDLGTQTPIDSKTAVFSDGSQLGVIFLKSYDSLCIKLYDIDSTETVSTLVSRKELNVHLLRRRILALGRAPFEDGSDRRPLDLDTPHAVQLDDSDDDPITSISSGQEFALLATRSGKVYYNGKGTSLGYKVPNPHYGRWILMKEIAILKNDSHNSKCKVIQVAVGHEGVHAVLVLDNGVALFTGLSRRGEDGDMTKYTRRSTKPTRPKKMPKTEGHYIVYAACNYGSSALVTRQGILLMYGKDILHCDTSGVVTALRQEKVIQVALGKAHAVALTHFGEVYTFGINNKGQCGREFSYTKEKHGNARRHSQIAKDESKQLCPPTQHKWLSEYCRVCVLCRECTGFYNSCQCASFRNRVPREKCGCGEGDSGCSICGVCRRCADTVAANSSGNKSEKSEIDDNISIRSDPRSEKDSVSYQPYEERSGNVETERESGLKISCLPPARVAVPGGHRIVAVACGLHHTVLLTEHGDVLTFGSNQFGQLGAGDISVHHRVVRVRVPRAASVAAGSNHTAIITRDGELFTFGSYQKGALGRPRMEEPTGRTDRCPIWYATPGRVPRLGPHHACKAAWVLASGDQNFVQVSHALIKTDTLFSSTITANSNSIVILPNRPEHTFKCVTINKNDGSCNAWTGPEQVDFVNSLTCLDPLYDVLWCYQPQMRVMKCYNILAFDAHKIQKCCSADTDTNFSVENDHEYPNFGSMKKMEDFKNVETVEAILNEDERKLENVALTNMSILNQELAIPAVPGCTITRMHAALHLLGCLDSLTYAHNTKLNTVECKKDYVPPTTAPTKEDFLTVNRFESHGGGWGYSGHSIEAVRFMCDTEILLGGYALFGGRGDYTARIKLFDIGGDGGDQEGDGELIAESDEIVYECAPRDKYPLLFETPVPIVANRWYVAWACVNGPSSDCGSSGQAMVINDEIGFHFKTSKKSNNGTDVNAGQIPCLLYNILPHDHNITTRSTDYGEPVISLSMNISRKVTVSCFKSLITLLQWSWNTFKVILLDTNGQVPINYDKLTTLKHQKRLVYVIRACLRIIKCYINEVFPQHTKTRNSAEYMSYSDAISDVKNLLQSILADPIPTCAMLPRKPGKNKAHRVCYVLFALEMTNSILKECHETVSSCYHAFFPAPTLKWNHLCSLLYNTKDGDVPTNQVRELTSSCAAMCASRSLRDVLQYIVPLTQNSIILNESKRTESKVIKNETPTKSATVPRSSHYQRPPPIPPRAHNRDSNSKALEHLDSKIKYKEWTLLDLLPRLLDIVMTPIKQQMMTRQCGQPHDHGEIKQHERLSKYCCKFMARIVAELAYRGTNVREDVDTSSMNKFLLTPTRFMRVNQSRAWNTGNGSPDAICFTVDRPGIFLAGVGIYGGLGKFEYELELLHDVQQPSGPNEESNLEHCWVSIEVVNGTFTKTDCYSDIVQLQFGRPVALKDDVRYAVRLCNHGGRTANGDCGLPSVTGPDGTTFRFASCSLSFNGTTLARGQIPCLLYYGITRATFANISESTDIVISALRGITLRFVSMIMGRCAELFCNLRNELTAEDLKRNAAVLQNSPAIHTLIPYTLAHLEGLNDSKSVVQMLEIIHKLLPHVAAMNLLVPNVDDTLCGMPTTTTGHYYTWVESEHPYKPASVNNIRVLFPPSVSWVVLEMDPRSITVQPEDSLTIYAVAGAPKHRCHCAVDARIVKAPFQKRIVQLSTDTAEIGESEFCDDATNDVPCLHYNCTYVTVTQKLSNIASEWPQKAILVPGNEVIFSLETASDYLNEYSKSNSEDNRFGFRCLCVGYEDLVFSSQRQGMAALEMELAYAGAACAARLLAPDLDIPPLEQIAIAEVQNLSLRASSLIGDCTESSQDASETMLLSRGLEMSSTPTIHHVLDGQPLLRCVSTERQFLADFVSGAESTAGGRLARWLAPTPQVEPSKCELKVPTTQPRPGAKFSLPVIIRDQYGEPVMSPALCVEIVVQRLEENNVHGNGCMPSDSQAIAVQSVPYQSTIRDLMVFHAITMMKAYSNYSFEELRFASGAWGDVMSIGNLTMAGRNPVDRLPVKLQPDGSYVATWTPRAAGTYTLRCTLDEHPSSQELVLEVVENASEGMPVADRSEQAARPSSPAAPAKLRRFVARFSAGLRIRANPSLQSEEIGRVPKGANVAFLEEVVNSDGTWVRLSTESIRAYVEGGRTTAWCLQYHTQLDKALLLPVDPTTSVQNTYSDIWGYNDPQGEMHNWNQDDDSENDRNEFNNLEERIPYQLPVLSDSANESDCSITAFIFGPEPSKKSRFRREDSNVRRMQRRSNGNGGGDEWWTPEKYRYENARIIEPFQVASQSSCLAQACTQTSPELAVEDCSDVVQFCVDTVAKEDDKTSSRSLARERVERLSRVYKRDASPPPPVPARSAAIAVPKKNAVSPSQAECLRSLFAAILWHEGIVHDAIACAAFLKFHPRLPKQGARVVTRGPSHDVTQPRPQRHSVEVSSAGQYLHIHPSTLESLTRSGLEASASRARKNACAVGTPPSITEEDSHGHISDSNTIERCASVVSVLPPALRALVALWDTLENADQLTPVTYRCQKGQNSERNENELDARLMSGARRKKDWKSTAVSKTPYSVRCELCGGRSVPPPLAAHMRQAHPGCRMATMRGYDRSGVYKRAESLPLSSYSCYSVTCGTLGHGSIRAYRQWYMFCESCREKILKNVTAKQPKTKTVNDFSYDRGFLDSDIDHHVMKENAIFLLDLVPLTNSESIGNYPWQEEGGNVGCSPPTPPSSMWQPAPPFQCLGAFGAGPLSSIPHLQSDAMRYHSLGRPQPPAASAIGAQYGMGEGAINSGTSNWPKVHRSLSMGQTEGSHLVNAASPSPSAIRSTQHSNSHDTLSGGGSSLLAQPSAALQRLVGCGDCSSGEKPCTVSAFESPRLDPETLMSRPVLTFVMSRRDLLMHRQNMDVAIRVNTVRQYAFEALNWLLRSVTQPTCVHDVMWWFCGALEKYACLSPSPIAADDNTKEGLSGDADHIPAAAALCPGGSAGRGARAAMHAFLGSVSALAPSLPPAAAATLQAVRCWALHYSPHDRAFLHRSQVFSVISKILSHAEDGAYEDGMLGAIHESFHSYLNKESYVWTCPDITGWCDVSVSSRQGMAGALTDGSTETFWESGDEDRNKAKWVQVSYPGGNQDNRPHLVCIHIDNTRDTANKTLMVSFLYSGGASELFHMQDLEVDSKAAAWICYTLPRVSCTPSRVRCELRGPDVAVRVRQLRVLAAPTVIPGAVAPSPTHLMHALVESETLRVFRLVTSQVFGKLLEWDRSAGSESGGESATGGDDVAADADDSDLREHVVGILFAGHKLTTLQRQVMSHIVSAIGVEATRARDDWETSILCADAAQRTNDDVSPVTQIQAPTQDNYCFEMLSLLLALSGSAVGRAHLALRTELLADLLALLHTGSERVQRQVISLLRRMIAEIPPQKMLAAINYGTDLNARVTLFEHLVSYLSKAITVQVKVKGSGNGSPSVAVMGSSLTSAPPAQWFMRGHTAKKHAQLVAKLLADMAEGKVSESWRAETRSALATYAARLATVGETERRPARCIAAPTMWLALAALCVCEESHLDLSTGGAMTNEGRDESRNRDSRAETRPFCANHDDGETLAIIDCRTCGPLCPECDRFLHLNRAARTHHRQICKEEESAIRIDIHEGCGRAKLFWLLLLVDRRTLKALAEFRGVGGSLPETGEAAAAGAAGTAVAGGPPGLAGTCRFCGTRGSSGLLAIGNVCADQQCQEHGRTSCARVLGCGHLCGGVRGERTCLPCLFACAPDPAAAPLRQDADDMCMICFTDPLQAAPAVQLKCGHVFHLHCCKSVLNNKWIGPRITFSFSQCPICKEDMSHWTLEDLLSPIRRLRDEVRRKALMRLEYEGLAASGGARARTGAIPDPATYAMERYAYYVCHKCGKAYFGGLARCEAETSGWWEPSELVCGACSDVAGARSCPKHGADFLEYKCRYCCSVAVFFCFGTSHFCNSCHDDFQRVTNIAKEMLPKCPAGPKGEQLPGTADECPLHVSHPPTGEEFALGCGVCRHAHAF